MFTSEQVWVGGSREVLVEGQDVWEEWTGTLVGDKLTEWRPRGKAERDNGG